MHDNLTFEVLGWTPSTKGVALGGARAAGRWCGTARSGSIHAAADQEEMTAWLEANKAKVKGKIVMVGKAAVSARQLHSAGDAPRRRQSTHSSTPTIPNAGRGGLADAAAGPAGPQPMTAAQVNEHGRRVAGGQQRGAAHQRRRACEHGLIRAFQNRTYDVAKAVPTVVLRNDDYGRIERLLADGDDCEARVRHRQPRLPEGTTTYNVVAEIPGTDKADEIVMLGGHLDSWHAATGATDNAIGSAMMMEAARSFSRWG